MIDYSQNSDERLIELARQGEELAFREIVKRYESKIATVVIGMLGNGGEAEDVGQETFIRFYRSMSNFKGASSLATYLTRIAINLSINSLNKRKKEYQFRDPGKSGDHAVHVPDETLTPSRMDTQEQVQQAIRQLDPAFRSVVVLRMIEGYSTKETAELLELPLGTVLSRLARAQDKLKQMLTPIIQQS